MARLLRECEERITPEYGCFVLADYGGDPLLEEGMDQDDREALTGWEIHHGAMMIPCSDDDLHPRVRLQAWDGEPPPAPGEWEEVRSVAFTSRHGEVGLGTLTGPGWNEFPIGPPHHAYGLRVHRTGTAEVARLRREWDPSSGEERRTGVVRYLLQFWPLRDLYDPDHYVVELD